MSDQRNINVIFLLDNPFVSDLRVEKEALGLVKLGYKVSIFCTPKSGLPVQSNVKGISIHRSVPSCYNRPFGRGYSVQVSEFVKSVLPLEFDVIHCHDSAMIRIGLEVKKSKPTVKLIYDTHEYLRGWKYYQDIKGVIPSLKGYLVWQYFLHYEKKACQTYVDGIITTTSAIAQKIFTDYKLSKLPSVLRNLTALEKSNEKDDPSLRSILNIPDDHFIMIQSGNIYQRLGEIEKMMEIAQEFKKLHYVIVNNRPIAQKITSLIKQQPEKFNRMHVIDYSSTTLLSYLKSSDFGLLYMRVDEWESHYFTSPNRIYEYTQAGLPFLSVPQTSSKELHDEYGHVVFFEQSDNSTFRSAISQMIENLTAYKVKASNIELRWEDEFESVAELYTSLTI